MSAEGEPIHDPQTAARIEERHRALAVGAIALPNLFLRSAITLGLLYGALGIVLIALVQIGVIKSAGIAVAIGCGIILLQYALGPWFMDLSLRWLYSMSWVEPTQLPVHLRRFVEKTCEAERMKFPSVGIIHDGAPTAFTYGHHPSNARVVISQGLIDLLTPDELEAVVAHELGHARNWDMALMTLANLVPLLLYYVYDLSLRVRNGGDNKGKDYSIIVAIGAYVLYVISEYLVLWFSRTREYYADRFAAEATGKPNALSMALVKIAYGLANRGGAGEQATEEERKAAAAKSKRIDAMGALNIFDRHAAVGLVMASASGPAVGPDPEQIKGAMQWDLWNPWALYYEIHSTHPLVAKRITALSDQAAALDQKPLVVFDRAKPESYWDDFTVDLSVMWAPTIGFLTGLAVFIWQFAVTNGSTKSFAWLGIGLLLCGLASLVRCRFSYRADVFEHLTVAALLHRVKVSAVRPVPCTLTGQIIGKGVPGLVWSEDFVMRDDTGLMFLDYRQPLRIWEWLFGLFRAGQYQGKNVRVTGWYRRSPVPYLEVKHIEVLDKSVPDRTTYSYYWQYIVATIIAVGGAALTCWALIQK
ncbi:MAG: zinc metalloprotease HtpX [Gemmataceae bacterium]